MAVTSPLDQITSMANGASPPGLTASLAQIASDRNAVPPPVSSSDNFWRFVDAAADAQYPIDAVRWNKLYPYQFLVVQAKDDGTYSAGRRWKLNEDKKNWSAAAPVWEFTLPVPPESLSISMPFASEVKATLDGVVEEHGGAPFRMISISGTTGVMPLRPSALQGPGDRTVDIQPGVIPAGTIQAVGGVVDTATRLIPTPNLMPASVSDTDGRATVGRGSGYYQFRLLQLFFERYAEVKQTAAGRDLRLAFASWKDQAVYLITPVSFELTRSASNPLAYSYRIQAKAWRRIDLDSSFGQAVSISELTGGGLGALPLVLETLSAARDTMIKLRSVIQAIRSDVDQALLEPVRESVLFAKDAAGVAVTLADLPDQMIRDARGGALSLERERARLEGATLGLITPEEAGIMAVRADGAPLTTSALGTSEDAKSRNRIGAFDNPIEAFSIFAQIQARRLRLSPQTQEGINREISRVRLFGRREFEDRRLQIEQVALDFADAIGVGSSVLNETKGRVGRAAIRVATDEDFEALWAMQSAAAALDRLAVAASGNTAKLEAVEYVAGLARASGMAFVTPSAKFAVPFPLGGSLERLAVQYLGDPNRWHEIATLNGLRSPYVDETGFELPLLVNGRGNSVYVADSSNLFVGQPVTISANNRQRTTRRIRAIEKIAGSSLISLSGDTDLDLYTIAANATLHAYLPDTVNSNQQIFIPSTSAVPEEMLIRDVAGINSFNTLLEAGGADLALTSSGDLVVTPDGDTPWVVGLNNLIQQVRIVLATSQGSLLQHPDFGLLVPVGASTADVDAKQLLSMTRKAFAQDPDFTGVFYASVDKSGPIVRQVIHVGVRGVDQLFPVGLEVVR